MTGLRPVPAATFRGYNDEGSTDMTQHIPFHVTAARRTREVAGDLLRMQADARRFEEANTSDENRAYWSGVVNTLAKVQGMLEDIDGCARADRREAERLVDERDNARIEVLDLEGALAEAEMTAHNAEEARRDAWQQGLQFAAQVEQRHAREALQQYVLKVLGKDRADGAIDLGALGKEVYAE